MHQNEECHFWGEKKRGRILEVHIWCFNHSVLILKKKNLKYIWHDTKIRQSWVGGPWLFVRIC